MFGYINFIICVAFQEAHVNQCYKHFYYFVTELNLVERKELEPLVSLLIYGWFVHLCSMQITAPLVSTRDGSISVSGQLRTYPSHNPTLTLTY